MLETVPKPGRRAVGSALLVHGLAGCARSPYVTRVAARLHRMGVRVIRMNLRGAGSGFGASRRFYHGGLTDDLRRVAEWADRRLPCGRLALVGFSLGANLVLKLAAEAADQPVAGLDCVLAANPPVDLAACCAFLRERGRWYDRNFVRLLTREVQRLHRMNPEGPMPLLQDVGSVFEFDDLYTAPRNGFAGAADYYRQCSSGPLLGRIEVPGLIVHAEDDPFIPRELFDGLERPPRLELELTPTGGHLGYVSRDRIGGDHRWLDARLAAWLAQRWNQSAEHPPIS